MPKRLRTHVIQAERRNAQHGARCQDDDSGTAILIRPPRDRYMRCAKRAKSEEEGHGRSAMHHHQIRRGPLPGLRSGKLRESIPNEPRRPGQKKHADSYVKRPAQPNTKPHYYMPPSNCWSHGLRHQGERAARSPDISRAAAETLRRKPLRASLAHLPSCNSPREPTLRRLERRQCPCADQSRPTRCAVSRYFVPSMGPKTRALRPRGRSTI